MEPKPKIRRYFTKQDYLDGKCDANGCAIPGGPAEPRRKPAPDSIPTQAQRDLAPKEPEPAPAGAGTPEMKPDPDNRKPEKTKDK